MIDDMNIEHEDYRIHVRKMLNVEVSGTSRGLMIESSKTT